MNDCGRSTDRLSGECFGCHIKGVGFTWVGGGAYGRKAFHENTIGEVIRETEATAKLQGREIAPKTTTYYGP